MPLTISNVRIDAEAEEALLSDISKYARSGDVDQFSTILSSAISYFATATGSRRLLANKYIEYASGQIADLTSTLSSADSDADARTSGSLIRVACKLVSTGTAVDTSIAAQLIPAMVTLSSTFLTENPLNVEMLVFNFKDIANFIAGTSGFDKINGIDLSSNFEKLREIENNMLSAVLQAKQPGQKAVDILSLDGAYIARAMKVTLQDTISQAISIQSPSFGGVTSPMAEFVLNFVADKTASVSVRTSVQPKSKWEKLPKSGILLSDLVDCTAFKDVSLLGQGNEPGFRARITLHFPLKAGNGTGSLE